MRKFNEMRKDYAIDGLIESDMNNDPMSQFQDWFEQALNADITEVNAMILSTVSANNAPSQRTVLLKEYNSNGFVFFSNYQSNKATDMKSNSQVSILFPWIELQRQIIISGTVEKIDREESISYFKTRPRGSQLGAWVSNQSSIIKSRDVLDSELQELTEKYENKDIPTPEHWGGYIIKPLRIEFWQGRTNRLHDRFVYTKDSDNNWKINRLSP